MCSNKILLTRTDYLGTSLVVQWLRLRASTLGGTGSIPGRGTKILHDVQGTAKKKTKNKKNTRLFGPWAAVCQSLV